MSNEINVQPNKLDETQALEYYNKAQLNQQRVESVKNDFEQSPVQDEFVSNDNKKGKTVGIIAGTLGVAALIFGGIVLKKGSKALEGKDAGLGEKLKQGWKELFGKGEKTAKEEALKGENKQSKEQNVENPKVDEQNVENPKVDEQNVENPKVDESKIEEPKVVQKYELSLGETIEYTGDDIYSVHDINNLDDLVGWKTVSGERFYQDFVKNDGCYNLVRRFPIKGREKDVCEIEYYGLDEFKEHKQKFINKNGKATRYIEYDEDEKIICDIIPRTVKGGDKEYTKHGKKIKEGVRTLGNGEQYIYREVRDKNGNLLRYENSVCGSRKKLEDVWCYVLDDEGHSTYECSYHYFDRFNRPAEKWIYDENGKFKESIKLEHKGFFNKILNFFDELMKAD